MCDDISIHALCEEGDLTFRGYIAQKRLFLSTPSARRATFPAEALNYFEMISIHALCEEGDEATAHAMQRGHTFLSTPSARRATQLHPRQFRPREISIHALCEEGDSSPWPSPSPPKNFYPRPLRGGRPQRPPERP